VKLIGFRGVKRTKLNRELNRETMVNVLCYKSKTLKNGENPLVIRVCKDGKKKYQSIGISVKAEYWDFEKNKPKSNCPNREQIINLITEKTKVFNCQILEYKSISKDFTAKTLIEKVSNPIKVKTVKEVFELQVKRLISAKRLRYAEMHELVKNSLLKFNGHLDIYFSDIDIAWLKGYETFLRSNNLKENTIGLRFRTIRTLFNLAIEEKIVKAEYYPFDSYKVSKLSQKTAKRSILKNEILEVLNYKGKTDYERLAIDLFTFSYLTAGINFVDIANLTKDNLMDKRIVYVRKKTKKQIIVPLQPKAIELINKYANPNNLYLFPILSPFHKTEQQKANRLHKVISYVHKSSFNDVTLP